MRAGIGASRECWAVESGIRRGDAGLAGGGPAARRKGRNLKRGYQLSVGAGINVGEASCSTNPDGRCSGGVEALDLRRIDGIELLDPLTESGRPALCGSVPSLASRWELAASSARRPPPAPSRCRCRGTAGGTPMTRSGAAAGARFRARPATPPPRSVRRTIRSSRFSSPGAATNSSSAALPLAARNHEQAALSCPRRRFHPAERGSAASPRRRSTNGAPRPHSISAGTRTRRRNSGDLRQCLRGERGLHAPAASAPSAP